jgi:type IV pilus assembly protein PilC
MAVYKYKAMKPDGEHIAGELILNSEGEAQTYLKKKEYFIIEIKEKTSSNFMEIDLPQKIKVSHLSVFCRKLHTMMYSGLPIVTALDILKDQTTHKQFKKVIQTVYDNIQKGMTLSEAMMLHTDVFPITMIFLIEAGEASGTIDSILDRLAIDFDKEHKIKNQIKAAMVYPIILIVAVIALLVFMLVFILPNFIGMFESSGVELPGITLMVIGLSESLTGYWYYYLTVILTGFILIKILKAAPRFKILTDEFKLKMPIFKKLFTLIVTTRFTRTLSTMLFSGVPLLQSLENCSRAIGNVYVSEKITYVVNEVRRGSSLAQPIKEIHVFPRMVDSMINIGEESGALDDILIRTTEYFEEELEITIKKMVQLFEPVMIVFMAGIVGIAVISMVMPLLTLPSTI